MTSQLYFCPTDSFCIEISGDDAVTVANNLTTNSVAQLEAGNCIESFVTNIRGWVVAHCLVARVEDKLLLVGRHADPQSICDHIQRYIIREDAAADWQQNCRVVLVKDAQRRWLTELTHQAGEKALPAGLACEVSLGSDRGWALTLPFFGCEEVLVLADITGSDVDRSLASAGLQAGAAEDLELLRIKQRWPLQGSEITEKTIPQELDRDEQAISFTKGCYLGQETIARLDARGQLQKKLCLIECGLNGNSLPSVGTAIIAGSKPQGKEVGALTAVASEAGKGFGLAFVKRGSFREGTPVQLHDAVAGEFNGTVIAPQANG